MRVLVAGATGALGTPVVRLLVQRGREVTGMTRRDPHAVAALGARPVLADALERDSLHRAVESSQPEIVVHLLTALPKREPLRVGELRATNRLRVDGTRNLVDAAAAAGVRRLVAESVFLVYGDMGDRVATEDSPLPARALHRALQESHDAGRSLEQKVLGAPLEGVVLRYGSLYGFDLGYTRYQMRMLRRGWLFLPGGGHGVASWVHVEDAAEATIAAMERGRPGEIYNIVDDEPVSMREYMAAMARTIGAQTPRPLPMWITKLLGPLAVAMATGNLRVSNEKAKRHLDWRPRYPTYREGIRSLQAG